MTIPPNGEPGQPDQQPFPPYPQNPYAQQPYAQNPYSQQPYTPNPYSQNPYATYAPPSYPMGYPVPHPPTSGLAIASMVLGIVGLVLCWLYFVGLVVGLVGAILGHVALSQINQRRLGGRGQAITGIACGWVTVGLSILVVVGFAVSSDGGFY